MVIQKQKFTDPSFSFYNRLARLIWSIVYLFFFRYTHRVFFKWRVLVLKMFGAKIGKNVKICADVKIWAPWNLIIEDEVLIGDGVDLYAQDKIFLGYRSIISQRSFICTGTHDYTDPVHTLYTKPIVIKPNAWVAAESFVGPGVTIEEYAVVGARSVVLKDVGAYDIVAGNPAKFIKKREFKNQINRKFLGF